MNMNNNDKKSRSECWLQLILSVDLEDNESDISFRFLSKTAEGRIKGTFV